MPQARNVTYVLDAAAIRHGLHLQGTAAEWAAEVAKTCAGLHRQRAPTYENQPAGQLPTPPLALLPSAPGDVSSALGCDFLRSSASSEQGLVPGASRTSAHYQHGVVHGVSGAGVCHR